VTGALSLKNSASPRIEWRQERLVPELSPRFLPLTRNGAAAVCVQAVVARSLSFAWSLK